MVNLLEALYVVTGACFLGAVLASLAGRAIGARMLFTATVACALAAMALYLYLSPAV